MIILAVKRQKTYTGAPTFKACFHFSCVNISYAVHPVSVTVFSSQ